MLKGKAAISRRVGSLTQALDNLPEGWRGFVDLFLLLPELDEERIALLNAYYQITRKSRQPRDPLSDRRPRISPELIADTANIPHARFLELVTSAAYEVNQNISGLILAGSEPQVVRALVARATQPEGDRAREIILRVSGRLPQPASATITNQVFNSNRNSTLVSDGSGPSDTFEQSTLKISEIIRSGNQQPQIASPSAEDHFTQTIDSSARQPEPIHVSVDNPSSSSDAADDPSAL